MASFLSGTMMLVSVIVSLFLYVLVHIPVYLLYKRWGYDKAWMAFFVFLHPYAISELSEVDGTGQTSILGIIVPRRLLGIILCIVNFLPFIGHSYGFLVSLIVDVFLFGTLFRDMYAKMDNKPVDSTRLLGVLSGLLYIIYWFKCFIWFSSNNR